MTINMILAGVGIAVLVIVAVLIGTSMDTEAQHRVRQAVAEERRRLKLERGKLAKERRALQAAKRRCSKCPFRTDG